MFLPTYSFGFTLMILYLPSLKMTSTSSISEQGQTYSASPFFNPNPTNPSSRLTYSFSFASTTLAAATVSNTRISVLRGWSAPYFSLSIANQLIVYSTRFFRFLSILAIWSLISKMILSASSELNFKILRILISISLRISSRVTSRTKSATNGFRRLST